MPGDIEKFESEPVREIHDLVLDMDGFEGPIDLLLTLARKQKVDLTRISISTLAEQYLSFISAAKKIRLEIAADYLVMAAWLAYLKSRLLLPSVEDEEDSSAPEMAEALTFQLRRLDVMRNAGETILTRPRLGRDVFARGALEVANESVYHLSLYELLKSYADNRRRMKAAQLTIEASRLHSLTDAIERMRGLLGDFVDWTALSAFLPGELIDGVILRSAVASTFAASLEMVKEGRIEIRQSCSFSPIYVKKKEIVANG